MKPEDFIEAIGEMDEELIRCCFEKPVNPILLRETELSPERPAEEAAVQSEEEFSTDHKEQKPKQKQGGSWFAYLLAAGCTAACIAGFSMLIHMSNPEHNNIVQTGTQNAGYAPTEPAYSEISASETTQNAGYAPTEPAYPEITASETTLTTAVTYSVHSTFSTADQVVLKEFADTVLHLYAAYSAAPFDSRVQPDRDFTAFGAPEPLNRYLIHSAPKAMTIINERNDAFSLEHIEIRYYKTYAIVRAMGVTFVSGQPDKKNYEGQFTLVIGQQDGQAVLLDLLRDSADSYDQNHRPEMFETQDADFWQTPEKYEPLLQALDTPDETGTTAVTQTAALPDGRPIPELESVTVDDITKAQLSKQNAELTKWQAGELLRLLRNIRIYEEDASMRSGNNTDITIALKNGTTLHIMPVYPYLRINEAYYKADRDALSALNQYLDSAGTEGCPVPESVTEEDIRRAVLKYENYSLDLDRKHFTPLLIVLKGRRLVEDHANRLNEESAAYYQFTITMQDGSEHIISVSPSSAENITIDNVCFRTQSNAFLSYAMSFNIPPSPESIKLAKIMEMCNQTTPDDIKDSYPAETLLRILNRFPVTDPKDVFIDDLTALHEQFPIEYLAADGDNEPYCIYQLEDGRRLFVFFQSYPFKKTTKYIAYFCITGNKLLSQDDFSSLERGMTLTDVQQIDENTVVIMPDAAVTAYKRFSLHIVEGGFIKIVYTDGTLDPKTKLPVNPDDFAVNSVEFIPNGGDTGDFNPFTANAQLSVKTSDYTP